MMNLGRPTKDEFVKAVTVAQAGSTIGSTAPAAINVNDDFPVGDLAILEVTVSYDGLLNQAGAADGTVITDGHLIFLNSLRIEGTKQEALVDGLDGLHLHVLEWLENGERPAHLALASNADNTPFRACLTTRLAMPPGWVRPLDTAFDSFLQKLKMTVQFGKYTQMLSGANASNNIDDLVMYIAARILPGPLKEPKKDVAGNISEHELPGWARHRSVVKEDVSVTKTDYTVKFDYGDKIIKRVVAMQRNNSTGVLLDNTVILYDSLVTVEVNGYPWVKAIPWGVLQDRTKQRYGLAAAITGTAVIFEVDEYKSVKDLLNLIDAANGQFKIIFGSTSVSNGSVHFVIDAIKNLKQEAIRPGAFVK